MLIHDASVVFRFVTSSRKCAALLGIKTNLSLERRTNSDHSARRLPVNKAITMGALN